MHFKSLQKKYKIIIFTLVACLIFLAIYFCFYKKDKPIPIATKPEKEKIVIPARPITFIEGKDSFINTVKLARLASLKNNQKDLKNYTKQSFILWRDVVNEFINTPPDNSISLADWTDSLSSVYNTMQEAEQLLNDSQFELVAEKLDKSRLIIDSLNSKKSTQNQENKLFFLLLAVKKISNASSFDIGQSYLSELKLAYTNIKNISKDKEFEALTQNFENILSEIDNSTSTTFSRAQVKLMPAFIKIYEKY